MEQLSNPRAMIQHLFVASVVNRVRQRPLDRLGNNLLNLLGNDGSVTTVLGVGLAGALVGLATGGVDLSCYQCLSIFSYGRGITYAVGKSLLKTAGGGLLDLAGDGRVALCVGLALAVLV
jgi:hypothetical protein